MKTKISRFGRSSVSVILAVMMLLSTMLIGTVSTVNAATTPLEEGTVSTVNASSSSITSDGTAVFYFNPNPNDSWSSSQAKLYLYFFGVSDGKWSNEATVLDSTHAYVKIPSGIYSKVILTRMDPNSTSEIP